MIGVAPMQLCMKCHKLVMTTKLVYKRGKLMCPHCIENLRLEELKLQQDKEEALRRR